MLSGNNLKVEKRLEIETWLKFFKFGQELPKNIKTLFNDLKLFIYDDLKNEFDPQPLIVFFKANKATQSWSCIYFGSAVWTAIANIYIYILDSYS